MKITTGKQKKAQRIVLYGVESVGKSTFASNFPKPLFLDVEGGTAHLAVDRVEINTADELYLALNQVKQLDYETIIIDSIDWTERLIIEAMLLQNKKTSIEDWGYGKGWIMVAEKMSRLITTLDELIAKNINVVLIAHSKVQRVEPPDLMTAYDRYELKLCKQASPLVKEWSDELWFLKFKTKVMQSENGKAKGTGGKERVMLTTHSAAYDAKTRSGLPEELPLQWDSVSHLFENKSKQEADKMEDINNDWEKKLTDNEKLINDFLIFRKVISENSSWRDCSSYYLLRVANRVDEFITTAKEWSKNL